MSRMARRLDWLRLSRALRPAANCLRLPGEVADPRTGKLRLIDGGRRRSRSSTCSRLHVHRLAFCRLSILASVELEPAYKAAHQAFGAIGIAGAKRSGATFRAANTPYAPQAILALGIVAAVLAHSPVAGLSGRRKADGRQRKGREADAKSLQRGPPPERLGHGFGQFIEFVVHNFRFVLVFSFHGLVSGGSTSTRRKFWESQSQG